MKWEYKVITPKMEGWIKKKVSGDTHEELNELGREGWELVGVAPVIGNAGTSWGGTTMAFVFFLKRALA